MFIGQSSIKVTAVLPRIKTFPFPAFLTRPVNKSRHTVVCRAAQEVGAPQREYINRKKENAIFTPM